MNVNLKNIKREDTEQKPAPRRAHHLIPVSLLKNNAVIQDAVSAGFDFNRARNGIEVMAIHGSHPRYTQYLERQIATWTAANKGNYSPEEARVFIEGLADHARDVINKNNGVVSSAFD